MILGMAPVRLSFAGGGTDYPEYYDKYGGNVVETTISKYVYLIVKQRHDDSFQAFSSDFETHQKPSSFDKLKPKNGTEIAVSAIKYLNYRKGIDLLISSDVPSGSGLGSSGSLGVNLVNVILKLKNEKKTKQEIAETAYHIGRHVLNWPIGKQDEYASCFGGLNHIKFGKNGVEVKRISINSNSEKELNQNLLLFFIGETRNSSIILTSQISKIKQNNKQLIESLKTVNELAELMYESLKNSDIISFGELLHKGWMMKKNFVKGVSNLNIDKIYEKALSLGALGGKLTGAGGGGHMILFCKPRKQKRVIEELTKMGLKQIRYQFDKGGAKILNLYDFKQV